MSTLIESITRAGRPGLRGRRAWGLAVPLLVAGALAAGCGSASSSAPAASGTAVGGGSAPGGNTAGDTAAPGTPTSGAVHGSAPATPVVPTVSGGPAVPGGVDCVGWPAGTGSVSLPA